MERQDFKSDRLNDEVSLFLGCTLKETMMAVLVSLSISGLISIPLMMFLFGEFTVGLAVALVLAAPILLALLAPLSVLKRGKPAGYYQQFLKIKLSKTGLIKNPYVMR